MTACSTVPAAILWDARNRNQLFANFNPSLSAEVRQTDFGSAFLVESLVRVGFAETTDTSRSTNQSVGILRITERGRVAHAVAAPASAPVPGERIAA